MKFDYEKSWNTKSEEKLLSGGKKIQEKQENKGPNISVDNGFKEEKKRPYIKDEETLEPHVKSDLNNY
jgi:hypothetical protein